jgi:hypothetical protein
MADTKISALTAATTPLAGTEVLPIVQSGTTKKVAISDLTSGRTVNASAVGVGVTTPAAGTTIEARNAAAGTAIRASNSGGGFVEIACESNATSNAQLNYTNQLTASGGNFVLSNANFVVETSGKGVQLPGGITWTSGSGSPEGVVTAPVGSLYSRSDGGLLTSLYVKQSGSGNTGWAGK